MRTCDYTPKVCLMCEILFRPNGANSKYCSNCSYVAEEQKRKEHSKRYRKKYKIIINKKREEWRKNNLDKVKKYRIKEAEWRAKQAKKKNPNYQPRIKLSTEEIEKRKKRRLETIRQCNKKRRLKLRIQVFSRDNFTCVFCGRKPPEVKLQIDHIHPKSKQGLDDIKNYQTLCSECNKGKGDTILEEYFD